MCQIVNKIEGNIGKVIMWSTHWLKNLLFMLCDDDCISDTKYADDFDHYTYYDDEDDVPAASTSNFGESDVMDGM